jgi:hypothetical protein
MKCESFGEKHKEKHQAENRVTVVDGPQKWESFYLCGECTGKLQAHKDYQGREIVVEKIIHKEESKK